MSVNIQIADDHISQNVSCSYIGQESGHRFLEGLSIDLLTDKNINFINIATEMGITK